MVKSKRTISEVTRRAIADRLAGHYDWAGRFSERDFLSRIYDLSEMPSHDGRFSTAAGDISQHRDGFRDWEDDWVFYDGRFNLIRCPDEEFTRFLAETVHPVVRDSSEQVEAIVEMYNEQLKADGWELAPVGEISGRAVFAARKIGQVPEVFAEPTGWARVDRQVQELHQRLRQAKSEEQFQGVGHLCREVLISVSRAVYDASRHPTTDGVEASSSDVKRMLEAYFVVELAGAGNAEARKLARVAFDFANSLQHDQSAEFREAALCSEAALSVVRIVAIVSGRRETGEFEA